MDGFDKCHGHYNFSSNRLYICIKFLYTGIPSRKFLAPPVPTRAFYKHPIPLRRRAPSPPPPWPPPQPRQQLSPRLVRIPSSNPPRTPPSFPSRGDRFQPSLALSAPSQLSLRGLPLAPATNPKYHNAKVDVGGEDLLRRFNWQVSRAGVMEEIRRRRRHEDARDKRKRKARSASRRYHRRRFKGPYSFNDDQGLKEEASDDEENDNWELPGGELPSYR